MLLPILIIQTRKFAALNTLGSAFFVVRFFKSSLSILFFPFSFGFLWGPVPYFKFLFSESRRLVTAIYLISVITTLYTSLWLKSTVLTIIASSFEAFALIW